MTSYLTFLDFQSLKPFKVSALPDYCTKYLHEVTFNLSEIENRSQILFLQLVCHSFEVKKKSPIKFRFLIEKKCWHQDKYYVVLVIFLFVSRQCKKHNFTYFQNQSIFVSKTIEKRGGTQILSGPRTLVELLKIPNNQG